MKKEIFTVTLVLQADEGNYPGCWDWWQILKNLEAEVLEVTAKSRVVLPTGMKVTF